MNATVPSECRSCWKDVLVLALVVALAASIFYFPWLSGSKDFYQTDLTHYFEPLCRFIGDTYRTGRIPLWNPYLYCGMPQTAVMSPGAVYPASLLFAIFPFSIGLAVYLIVHQVAAAIGTYLLVRRLGWGRLAAVSAGVAFGLCGYMYTVVSNFTLIASATWIPWLLYFVYTIKGFDPASLKAAFGLSVSVFLSIAAGRPEVWLGSLSVAAAVVGISGLRVFFKDRRGYQRVLLRILAMAAGLAMALPVLLPAVEWTRLSTRQHGMDVQYVMLWSANWYDWLCMVVLSPLSDLSTIDNPFYNAVGSRHWSLPYVGSAFLGPIVFSLAVFSIFAKWKWRFWCLGVLVLFVVLCLGEFTPVAPFVVKHLAFLSFFRYPIKLIVVPAFVLILMAARGFHAAIEKQVPLWLLAGLTVLWTASAGLGFYLESTTDVLPFFSGLFSGFAFHTHDISSMQELFGKSFLGTGILGVVGMLLCFMHKAGMGSKSIIGGALTLILSLTLFLSMARFPARGVEVGFFSKPQPLADRLKGLLSHSIPGLRYSTRGTFIYPDPLFWGSPDQGEGRDVSFYAYARQVLSPNQCLDFGVPVASGYEAASKGAYSILYDQSVFLSHAYPRPRLAMDPHDKDAVLSRFLSNAATDVIAAQSQVSSSLTSQLDQKYFDVIETDPSLNLRIFRSKKAHPRTYFADSVSWVTDGWRGFASKLEDLKDPSAMSTVAYVERQESDADLQIAPAKNQDIKAICDDPEYLKLEVDTNESSLPSFLVLADTYYPGWQVAVDGKSARLYKVNGFFRGVLVPAGKHTVEFSFRPTSFYAGIAAAAAVLLLYAVMLLLPGFKPKASEP